ncbi:Na+/H+ antiporter NhaC family protein [Anaerosphaera multitolerans]|uniref:Na+/H+ antiporter NhaC family protein n=1 Tax=Anaerosphaera multitolerans TaxID=2487351 RepID=UPI001F0B8AB2|nr:Na+/H+ antiporter NhaC family protein [Anaerosphaera multitolerans]
MVVIYVLCGGFSGITRGMGAVDSIVNFALSIIPSNLVLPGLFLVGCLLSFAMGTSMGTVAALMPIGIGIAEKSGVSLALVSGVVVGSAMFGDNLSFISDTTIAATRTQNIKNIEKFKANAIMVLPAFILTIAWLLFQGGSGAIELGTYNLFYTAPYILVIVLSLMGLNVAVVLGLGIALSVVIGVINGSFTLLGSFAVLHEGIMGMEDMAVIAVIVGGIVELMRAYGGIDFLLYNLTKTTKTKKGAELSIAGLVSLLDLAMTNNTISIIAAGSIARDISQEYDIAPQRVASLLDIFASAFNGLAPYAGQLLVAGGMAGIAPASIMPYNVYCILMLVFGLLSIITGVPNYNKKVKTK